MNTTQFIQEIRDLIARDELTQALQFLRQLLANSPKLDEALHQSGRFENIRRQIRLGTISHAEANLTQNQIRAGLLELLSEIENSVGTTSSQASNPALREEIEHAISIVNTKNIVVGSSISAGGNVTIGDTTTVTESQTSRRLRLFLYLFVPLLALSLAYLWYRVQPVTLTVVAEQTRPIPELPFSKGNLVLYHGGKPEPKTIENEVIFTSISRGEHVSLHFDAPGFVRVDTAFEISGNQLVQLPVRRDNSLTHIAGTVKDKNGKPLEGAQIIVLGITALTDAAGEYALEIPYLQQRREQNIRAVKDGHEGFNKTRTIVAGESNDILFENQ